MKLAYLSGSEGSGGVLGSTFDCDSVKALVSTAGMKPKIDILITCEWPQEVYNFASSPVSIFIWYVVLPFFQDIILWQFNFAILG